MAQCVRDEAPACCAGSPSGNQPIRSRLVDDSPAVISPPGGPPGLNMRRGPLDGPPGTGEWHPGSEGWRRAGGPPQEWRGPPGPMGEDDAEAMSPRRHGSGRPSQVNTDCLLAYKPSHVRYSCVLKRFAGVPAIPRYAWRGLMVAMKVGAWLG